MKKLAQFAIGYIVILILEKLVVGQKDLCNTAQEGEYKTAKCMNQKFTNIPPDLDNDIKKLDISGSDINELNGDSFKNYNDLIILKCENIKIKTGITDKYLFKFLTKLQEVYFKGMNLTEASTFQWPSSIKIIHIIDCMVTNLNLASAVHLKELDASSNSLQDIPVFSETAPINYVNLRANPLGGATVASLARACRVNNIDLSLTGNSDLKTQKLFCTCKAILLWINEYYKKSNVIKEEDSFKCSTWAEKDANCEKGISPAALKIREDCLAKTKQGYSLLTILIIVLCITTVVLVSLCLFAYLYGSLLKKKEAGDVIEIHHGDASPTISEEHRIEEEDNLSESGDEPHLV